MLMSLDDIECLGVAVKVEDENVVDAFRIWVPVGNGAC